MPRITSNHGLVDAVSTASDPQVDRPRVLLAEDMGTARALTSRLLERMGCYVDAVEDGEQALSMARNVQYNVFLLDLDMPLMGAAEAARAIRSHPNDGATLIIALSAFLHGLGDSTDSWLVFDGKIAEPISLDRLRQVVLEARPACSVELDTHGPMARKRPGRNIETTKWLALSTGTPRRFRVKPASATNSERRPYRPGLFGSRLHCCPVEVHDADSPEAPATPNP